MCSAAEWVFKYPQVMKSEECSEQPSVVRNVVVGGALHEETEVWALVLLNVARED